LKCDVSYTSRKPREGEIDGVHYHFVSQDDFAEMIVENEYFYEWVEYNGNYYGTGMAEWNELPLFIMETDGIKHIRPEDRKDCFIIYVNPPDTARVGRMRLERKWDYPEIQKRIDTDKAKFDGFKDYDMEVTNPHF